MSITAAQIEACKMSFPNVDAVEYLTSCNDKLAAERAEDIANAANRKAWEIANPELALGEKIDRRLTFRSQKDVASELGIEVNIVRKRKALTRAYWRTSGGSKATLDAAWIEVLECPLAALCRAAQ